MNVKKLILLNFPYLLFVYPFDKVAQAFQLAPGADLSAKILAIGDGFTAAFSSVGLSLNPADLLIGLMGAVILRLAVWMKGKNAKKYRHGMEYGSARWGTPADIAPYMDKDFFNNIPMTQTERITMASRPKQPKYARNKNILVIGGSGSGKTRFFCKPSLLQAHSSYVCTDPKGILLPEIGSFLERKKYRIKCLNLINFKKSMRYNPLAYIRSEKDILKLVNALIMNTKGEGEKSSEDFWVKAERLYYSALIGYIWYEAPEEERNFITLLDLINASEAREDDEEYQSPVDILFQQLEEKEPDHFAVKQYRKFKMAAGKTLKSILISCGARLAPFDIKELRDLMETDELELDTLGDSKTALFVIISDTDSTFNFVAALMYSQLFNLLCDKADDFYGGRLPVHVRLILDEFANIGQIPNFDKLIATIRSREISWIRRKIEYRRSLMEHLPRKTCQNGIGYTLVGDYYIPDLQLPEESRPIGIWGRMHKAYLEQCHPVQYNDLLLTGKLWTYLADLNEQAQNRLNCIIAQMKKTEGITEELKARDQLAWVGAMSSIRNRAKEIVRHELIYDAKEGL